MAIKFLETYSTQATPPEHFKAGQVVEDRDDASEGHFVNRGRAAYLRDGKLIDRFGAEIADPFPAKSEKVIDYVKDKLAKLDPAKANEGQLRVIAATEIGETIKVDDADVAVTDATEAQLVAAIEAKRKG